LPLRFALSERISMKRMASCSLLAGIVLTPAQKVWRRRIPENCP
jgi:hypothetical protein